MKNMECFFRAPPGWINHITKTLRTVYTVLCDGQLCMSIVKARIMFILGTNAIRSTTFPWFFPTCVFCYSVGFFIATKHYLTRVCVKVRKPFRTRAFFYPNRGCYHTTSNHPRFPAVNFPPLCSSFCSRFARRRLSRSFAVWLCARSIELKKRTAFTGWTKYKSVGENT